MLTLVRFGKNVHIFDTEQKRYVKLNYRNLLRALRTGTPPAASRRKILRSLLWTHCDGKDCPLCRARHAREKQQASDRQEKKGFNHFSLVS